MVAIFVAFMFVSLVLTDLGVEKYKAWQAAQATQPARTAAEFGLAASWRVPEGVHLSDAHTWFRPNPSGGLEVGADSFIANAVGAVRQIVLPRPGDQITKGQPLFRLLRDGRSITVPSTLTGRVATVNSRLLDQPDLLTSDPYGSGWICRIAPTPIVAVTPSMRFGEKASLWLESELTRLSEFLSARINAELALGATSLDGGVPAPSCLAELDLSAWRAFESEFLKCK